jgi:hypothetical protein
MPNAAEMFSKMRTVQFCDIGDQRELFQRRDGTRC